MSSSLLKQLVFGTVLIIIAIFTFIIPYIFDYILCIIFSLFCMFPLLDIFSFSEPRKWPYNATDDIENYACESKYILWYFVIAIILLCILYFSKAYTSLCFLILFIILYGLDIILRQGYQQ